MLCQAFTAAVASYLWGFLPLFFLRKRNSAETSSSLPSITLGVVSVIAMFYVIIHL